MLNFVKFLSYLTVQQGKNQDTKVNKKRVFLWLGDRMCLNAVNSQLFENEYNFVLEHYEGKTWNERHRETQFASGIWMFYQKMQKRVFLMDFSDQNCLLSLIQL